mmetsp:Transcript_14036/g.43695  ORF Transcript_14036/g.43695 Transcript_14036/m.43695 type:complete len:122 (-) Transcript_14036:19-384(-)
MAGSVRRAAGGWQKTALSGEVRSRGLVTSDIGGGSRKSGDFTVGPAAGRPVGDDFWDDAYPGLAEAPAGLTVTVRLRAARSSPAGESLLATTSALPQQLITASVIRSAEREKFGTARVPAQ